MTSLYKFENIKIEDAGFDNEPIIIGGTSISFKNESSDMPHAKFENLIIPIGLQYSNNPISGGNNYDENDDDHTFMDESRFSKLFYSVAKDLGSSRKSITKKNRR